MNTPLYATCVLVFNGPNGFPFRALVVQFTTTVNPVNMTAYSVGIRFDRFFGGRFESKTTNSAACPGAIRELIRSAAPGPCPEVGRVATI